MPSSLYVRRSPYLRAALRPLAALALATSALPLAACSPASRPPTPASDASSRRGPPPDVVAVPPRARDAPDGRRFLGLIKHADEPGRERAILRELKRGNMPDSQRRLSRIDFKARTRSGKTRTVTLWVTRDYLSIGSEADSVRMPMGAVTAQLVADATGCVLPTPKIVDIVYAMSAIKLTPQPFPPGPWMVHTEEFARHNEAINEQLRSASNGASPRASRGLLLLAGHKKDIVLSNRLEERPHRVAIYGWHRSVGRPIQPLSTVHGDWYADYSHGVRLVGGTMLIDGEPRRVADVLLDPELSPLLSEEGALVRARYQTDDGPGRTKWWPTQPATDAPSKAAISTARSTETP